METPDILGYFSSAPTKDLNAIDSLTSQVYGVLTTIGYISAVIILTYIGIRYMIAKPSEKAQLKSSLTYVFAGSLLLIGGSTILGIVGGVFADTFGVSWW